MTTIIEGVKTIGVRAAARKYNVPFQTISRWVKKKELKVYEYPERRGDSILLIENSLRERLKTYKARKVSDEPITPPSVAAGGLNGDNEQTPTARILTAEYVRRFSDANYGWAETSRRWYGLYLKPFIDRFKYVPVAYEEVERYLSDMPTEGAQRYHHYRTLVTFYRWISGMAPARKAADGRRNRPLGIPNLMEEIRAPYKHFKPATAYSVEEIKRVIDAATKPQDKMMLLLTAATQIRSEAIRTLTVDKVHDDYIAIKPKDPDSVEELVPCDPQLCAGLKMLGPGYCFKGRKGQPLSKEGVYHRFDKCFQKAGVSWGKTGPHAFRHSGATMRLEKTDDLSLVQAALGHRSIETTTVYTHRNTESQKRRLIETSPFLDLGGADSIPVSLRQPALPLEYEDTKRGG
jgi:integrase